jgi:hypothetical protein
MCKLINRFSINFLLSFAAFAPVSVCDEDFCKLRIALLVARRLCSLCIGPSLMVVPSYKLHFKQKSSTTTRYRRQPEADYTALVETFKLIKFRTDT